MVDELADKQSGMMTLISVAIEAADIVLVRSYPRDAVAVMEPAQAT